MMVLSSFGSVTAQTALPVDSSYAVPYYAQRLAFFRLMPDQKNEIVFLGNSLIEWGEWQELLARQPVVNRGISGDNTYGVLARLDEVVSSRPARIYLMVGTNDLLSRIPDNIIIRNYSRILSQIRVHSPKTRVYIHSLLPVNEPLLPDTYKVLTNEKIRQLNQKLRQFAEANSIPFVNVYEVFADDSGQLRKELSLDGLHITSSAYIEWVDFLRRQKYLR